VSKMKLERWGCWLMDIAYRCDESKVERRLPLWYFLEHG
jgi:hypothetical protein